MLYYISKKLRHINNMKISNAKFLNSDRFDNLKFWITEENDDYKLMKGVAKKLKHKYKGYQPVFASEHGVSITVKKYDFDFSDGSTYNIHFAAAKKTRQSDDTPYVVLKLTEKPILHTEHSDEILDLENL